MHVNARTQPFCPNQRYIYILYSSAWCAAACVRERIKKNTTCTHTISTAGYLYRVLQGGYKNTTLVNGCEGAKTPIIAVGSRHTHFSQKAINSKWAMQASAAIIHTTLSKQPALANCAAITHGRRIHAALAWLMSARVCDWEICQQWRWSRALRKSRVQAEFGNGSPFSCSSANWRLRRKSINVNDSSYFFVANG